MEAVQVYHLTIQENGHSRRFVYEDRDEALTRLADAIAAGLDAKLDVVVRGFATPPRKEHTPMQALRVSNYKIIKGTFPELADEAKGGMLSTFKAQRGFIRYGLADTGQGTCLSISLWESNAEAEAAAPVAATWVSEHLADRVELRSNEGGDLAFFEGVPTSV